MSWETSRWASLISRMKPGASQRGLVRSCRCLGPWRTPTSLSYQAELDGTLFDGIIPFSGTWSASQRGRRNRQLASGALQFPGQMLGAHLAAVLDSNSVGHRDERLRFTRSLIPEPLIPKQFFILEET